MRVASILSKLLLITVLAIVTGFYAILAIPLGGIHSSNWTGADVVRDRCPIRLIQPEWVSSQPDTLMNWYVAETRARVGLIGALWLGAASIIVWRDVKKRKNARTG